MNLILFMLIPCLSSCSSPAGEILTPPSETVSEAVSENTVTETASADDPEAEVTKIIETAEETAPEGPVLEIGGKMHYGSAPSAEQLAQLQPVAEDTLREYALFFIYMGSDLESRVDPSCPLHDYLFGSDSYSRMYNEYYNHEYIDSYSFSEFETSDYIIYGDEYFTANVKYKLEIEFSRPDDMEDNNQTADAVWTFRNTDDGWKLSDVANSNISVTEAGSDDPEISILKLRGKDYDGALIVLSDASRLFCATVPEFVYDYGQTVPEMIDSYEENGYRISGGINGGNFDDGGTGSSYTAMPLGAVLSEGIPVFSEYGHDYSYHMTGFTEEGELIIGNYSINEALALGIRDAVYTTEKDGPFLISGGAIQYDQLTDTSVYGAGKNPRTAIGQRADGSVLLLVINGRQPSSLGASFEELAQIMLEFGAVTASAMDGGTSSQMIWNGQVLNHPFSAFGLRMCPTAWLIRDHSS